MADIPKIFRDIKIPISNQQESQTYASAIISILSRVELECEDYRLKEDLKAVYKLLGHIQASIEQQKEKESSCP